MFPPRLKQLASPSTTRRRISLRVGEGGKYSFFDVAARRAGRANPNLRCALMALTRTPQQDSGQPPSCSCSPVQTFSAGSSCKLLTKSAVFKSPSGGGTLVCTGDEASNSTWVSVRVFVRETRWNVFSGVLGLMIHLFPFLSFHLFFIIISTP